MLKYIKYLLCLDICFYFIYQVGCSSSVDSQKLIWPPDTISATRVHGNIYEVTTVPEAEDPKMTVILIWPPDTTEMLRMKSSKSEEDISSIKQESKAAYKSAASSKIWPPDTTDYPSKILMIWPPDTTD